MALFLFFLTFRICMCLSMFACVTGSFSGVFLFLHAYQSSGKMVSSSELLIWLILSLWPVFGNGVFRRNAGIACAPASSVTCHRAFDQMYRGAYSISETNVIRFVVWFCLHIDKLLYPSTHHSAFCSSLTCSLQWSYGFYLIHLQGKQGFQFFCKTEETKRKWMEQFDMAM